MGRRDVEVTVERAVTVFDLLPLFAQAGWTSARNEQDAAAVLESAAVVVSAWHDDRLVGFARVLSDDRFRALIDDVIVDESYRGQGIGSSMMQLLNCRLAHVEEVFLRCENERVGFYQRNDYQDARLHCMDLKRTELAGDGHSHSVAD